MRKRTRFRLLFLVDNIQTIVLVWQQWISVYHLLVQYVLRLTDIWNVPLVCCTYNEHVYIVHVSTSFRLPDTWLKINIIIMNWIVKKANKSSFQIKDILIGKTV
jgi:hypothetical protein